MCLQNLSNVAGSEWRTRKGDSQTKATNGRRKKVWRNFEEAMSGKGIITSDWGKDLKRRKG